MLFIVRFVRCQYSRFFLATKLKIKHFKFLLPYLFQKHFIYDKIIFNSKGI